ncbi:MAG: hypothetical protein EA428_01720 [Spirochaetaceae bacterium]|nr:MAG: hypothetical protein EA428_01720 [Spirochaetaceae bacterium]
MKFIKNKMPELVSALVLKRPKLIIAAFAVAVVLSIVAAGRIEIITQTEDMLPAHLPVAQQYNEVLDTFHSTGSIIVTVENASRAEKIAAAHRLEELVRAHHDLPDYLNSVELRADREFLGEWALLLQDADDIAELEDAFAELNILPFLRAMNDSFEDTFLDGDGEQEFATNEDEWAGLALYNRIEILMNELHAYVQNPESRSSEEWGEALAEAAAFGELYNLSPDGDMLIVSMRPNFSYEDFDKVSYVTTEVREIVQVVGAEFPELRFGVGGDIPLQHDRHAAIEADLLLPTLFALVLIVLFFLVSFDRIRSIAFAVISLVVGIIITTGVIGMTTARLDILSNVFAVILLGLGIDFGIHMVSNFDDFRRKGFSVGDALSMTLEKSGVAIVMGGITTAVAFFSLTISSSMIISNFGYVAGVGVLVVLLTTTLLLPALLVAFGRQAPARERRYVIRYEFLRDFGAFVSRRRVPVIAAALVLTVLLATQIPNNRPEYDILNMMPRNAESVGVTRSIIDRMEVSPFPSYIVVDNPDEAHRLAERAREERLVSRALSLRDYIATDEEQAQRLSEIARLRGNIGTYDPNYSYDSAAFEDLLYEIQRLEWNLIEIADLTVAGLGDGNRIQRKRNAMIREIFGAEVGEPGAEVFQNLIATLEGEPQRNAALLSSLEPHFAGTLSGIVERMVSPERPITVADLPHNTRSGLVNESGDRFLVTVVGTAETQQEGIMLEYDERMAEIMPGFTGYVPLAVMLTRETFEDGGRAAIYAGGAVFLIMLILFRSLKHTLFAFGGLAVAIIWMFGLIPLLGIQLNMMAAVVFPLIVGIGTDFAMHMLHRFHKEGRIDYVLRYSGKAILLSSITTMIGFGSLALVGEIVAIAALGLLLFIGIGCCMLASLTFIPAFLAFGEENTHTFQEEYHEVHSSN